MSFLTFTPGPIGILFLFGAAAIGAFILYVFVIGVRNAQIDVQELDEADASASHSAVHDVPIVTDHGIEHRIERD